MFSKTLNLISSQVYQVRADGLVVLLEKTRSLFLIILALPIVILVRILRPLIRIRFGKLISLRIGHLAINTELYLCDRDSSTQSHRTFDVFYHIGPISSHQLGKMWNKILCVSSCARWLDRVNQLIPGGGDHVVSTSSSRDVYGHLAKTPPHLTFTNEEEEFGKEQLKKLGIPGDYPFVCFHARSFNYCNEMLPKSDWERHNYRDSDIRNYILAAQELVSRDYYTIRLGYKINEPLRTKNSKIIDYAFHDRTDFLDIYLGAKCRFFIGSACGITSIPMIFRRPIAWTNFIPLEHAPTWGKNDLFIPKKLWLREERRFLAFKEIIQSGIGRFLRSCQYEERGIEVVENTNDEIVDLVVEMDERLKGLWQSTPEDEELQRRFWALFKPSDLNQVFLTRIGCNFLRQNRELLN